MLLLLSILSVVVYYMIAMMPDPIEERMAGNPNMKAEDVARLKKLYGLDKPIYFRYISWVKQILTGDFGQSRVYKIEVVELIGGRAFNTLKLMICSFILDLTVAIPLGIYAGLKQYSAFDYSFNFLAFIGISLPSFWLGILLIIIFSVKLGLLPASGMMTPGSATLWDQILHLILPILSLSIQSIASWARYMRASMLEVVKQDYIRTARAKGLPERTVILKHAFRNCLIPLVTIVALSIPALFSGALITETIFAWPGMGRLLYDSVVQNDYSVAMMAFMILATLTFLFNLLADIAYTIVDPRVTKS